MSGRLGMVHTFGCSRSGYGAGGGGAGAMFTHVALLGKEQP